MTDHIQAMTPYESIGAPLSVETIKKQIQVIQEVMQGAMVKDTHYGTIPGTDKPTLLKAGAEKLCLTFRLSPTYTVTKTDLGGGHREYEVRCTLTHIPSQSVFGEGVGVCSTMESKYRWRKGERVCPECGKSAIIKGKAEYGGGWLCFAKKGGCGAKFDDKDPVITSQEVGRVENQDIADVFNTVLKIAKKRAHVDAVLTATAASDIFAQDLDEMAGVDEAKTVEGKPTVDDKTDDMLLNLTTCKTVEEVNNILAQVKEWDGEAKRQITQAASRRIKQIVEAKAK